MIHAFALSIAMLGSLVASHSAKTPVIRHAAPACCSCCACCANGCTPGCCSCCSCCSKA